MMMLTLKKMLYALVLLLCILFVAYDFLVI